jgi:hypothetical protein
VVSLHDAVCAARVSARGRHDQPIENRIKELAETFAVGIGGFSVMDNHLHLLLRLDPNSAQGWSDEEVVRRWGRLFPPRDKSRKPLPISNDWVQEQRIANHFSNMQSVVATPPIDKQSARIAAHLWISLTRRIPVRSDSASRPTVMTPAPSP